MLWDDLTNINLQNLVGDDILAKLEELLPSLAFSDDQEIFDINKKSFLKKIVSAFITSSYFQKKDNILAVLNCLSEERIDECIEEIYPALLNASFNDKINFIADHWNKEGYNKKIVEWAGLSEEFLLKKEKKSVATLPLLIPDAPYKTLKNYQIPVFLHAQRDLEDLSSRFILQMPTGSGKTRTAMEIVTDFINSQTDDTVVIWLAHSEELCEQALECFIEVWQHVGKKELTAYRCWGSDTNVPKKITGNAFIVAGFGKLNASINSNPKAFDGFKGKTKLIIVDEAHKVMAPTYEKVTKALINVQIGTRVVGLTATPGRHMNDPEGNKALSDFFFNKCFTIDVPKGENVISYLRDQKVLSNVKIDPIICQTSVTLTAEEKRYLEKNFDFPPGFLKRLGEDQIRNLEILKKLEQAAKDGHQILFFACSIEHSMFICSMLIYLGFKAAHIDGSTNKNTRQKLLKQFKNNEIQIICNFGVLSTGFDAPKTDVVCISRPTQSIVLYSQMIGRGLRGPAIGGTQNCTLINVRDNIQNLPNYKKIFDYFEDYWV